MFGSHVIDVAVGLIFVYFLLSIICTAASEMIAALFALRARNLAAGIANLLADKRVTGLTELFYEHPLIKTLYRGKSKPSYIPPHTFALAFLDGIAPAKGDSASALSEIKTAVDGLADDSELKRVLLVLLQQAGDDYEKLQINIEMLYSDAMSRVSGWYKRKSQVITMILAILVTGLTNADTFQIVKTLSTDPALRATVVAEAQNFINQHPGTSTHQPGAGSEPNSQPTLPGDGGGAEPGQPLPMTPLSPVETMTETLGNLQQLGIPLGWQVMPRSEEWVNKVIGLLLTIFAISLGAPFWFDVLNRVTKIRSTGPTPETPAEEKK